MKRIIILIALACNMLCAAAHTNISHSIAKYIEKNIGFIDSLQIANIEKMNDKGDSLTFKNGFNEDTSMQFFFRNVDIKQNNISRCHIVST